MLLCICEEPIAGRYRITISPNGKWFPNVKEN